MIQRLYFNKKGIEKMPGIIGISVNRSENKEIFSEDLFKGVFYQQHWNEDYSGLAVRKDTGFEVEIYPGLFRESFNKKMDKFNGTEGIGYCGIAEEPFEIETRIGNMCLCFSGNIRNSKQLKETLKKEGISFSGRKGYDLEIEIIANMIAQGKDTIDGIKKMGQKIEGAFTLLVLTMDEIFAVRSSDAHWALTIGQKEGETVIASSSAGFRNLGLSIIKDLEPGEIISMKEGVWKKEGLLPSGKVQICSFLGVYTDFPSGSFRGVPISLIRKRLGAALAQRDIKEGFIPDIVAAVPNSGIFYAIGYHQEFCRQINSGKIEKIPLYDEVLLKWPYAGRSFTSRTQEKREKETDLKMLTNVEDYTGKIIVIIDDSIVRGTTMRTNLIPKLRRMKISEIHLRIGNPPILSYCPWGKTTKKKECFAVKVPSNKEKIKHLKVESIKYNSIKVLVDAIGIPINQLCRDCSLLP